MTVAVSAGTEAWARRALETHWQGPWEGYGLRPLTVGGAQPLTHTAGLWRVSGIGGEHVLKVRLDPEAERAERFTALKDGVIAHCRRRGVPALPLVPAADGSPGARHEGVVCELSPFCAGTVTTGAPDEVAAIVRTGLDLREALDVLPPAVADELAAVPLPRLVEEEDWRVALDDAEHRLLPKAERGTGPWCRAAARVLRELCAAAALLPRGVDGGAAHTVSRPAVVHADLHLQHFLLAREPARVVAVLDFDNLHTGDRLLDLAWLADTVAHACGADRDEARRALAGFLAEGRRRSLIAPGDEARLMPLLLAYSLPVIVDIAKDILDRGILLPQWLDYFALLSPGRRHRVHQRLTGAAGS
ncbi:phosphotransferase [Streptomyces sp. GC420]|uniref:phosphotransferase n=1 Tax=Streptomyces sp. GC420 TaxID=2697568 RepID=UPI001414E4FA|nr:phosphotransferase [Streptomyces sp. GC420]NBM21026.1 phosphotransferase [Streptomyces sp. GC420]